MSAVKRHMFAVAAAAAISFVLAAPAPQYTATYDPNDLPDTTEEGQSGTNDCGTTDSQTSMCQNAYLNSLEDWCLFAPPEPNSVIGETERIEVAWCTSTGRGTRLIPEGAILGAHITQTSEYIQITGHGDLTKLNVAAGDSGGELDPHGADGNGNPIGGLVFSDAFSPGKPQQIHEWMNFMSATEFCIRICRPSDNAWLYCQHEYDVMGCGWVMPGNYADGFDNCEAEAGAPPGIVGWGSPGASTFHQGDANTPPAAPAPSSSNCKDQQSLVLGQAAAIGGGNATSTAITSRRPTATSRAPASPTGEAENDESSATASLARPFAAFLVAGAVALLAQ